MNLRNIHDVHVYLLFCHQIEIEEPHIQLNKVSSQLQPDTMASYLNIEFVLFLLLQHSVYHIFDH